MKLVEVMACVDRVAKNGNNASQGYKYAMAADVYAEVRGELARRFVLPVPRMDTIDFHDVPTKAGGILKFATWKGFIDFTDAETGEVLAVRAFGQGSDSGDKSGYKAITGATKQCLVQLFLIPTGDDPEHEKPLPPPPPAGLAGLKAKMPKPPASAPRDDEPPPPSDADAPPDSGPVRDASVFPTTPPTHDRLASFKFGNGKGKPLHELEPGDLKFYSGALNRDLADATKAQWHEKTRAQLANLTAEIRYRGL